ncbi:hypothetical protein BBJ28_00019997 [Nothophytophthora sp. Chile5]|nr:hypothetical protein BBJ28_00019997 [Nothophytophthora sp. Chile5]
MVEADPAARSDAAAAGEDIDGHKTLGSDYHYRAISLQSQYEDELDRIRTEGDLALIKVQTERKKLAEVEAKLQALAAELKKKKKKKSSKTSPASAPGGYDGRGKNLHLPTRPSDSIGSKGVIKQLPATPQLVGVSDGASVGRRLKVAASDRLMEKEERLKVAISERTVDLQKLRHAIDETRRERLEALASEQRIIAETCEAENDVTRVQEETEKLKHQMVTLKSEIVQMEQAFDAEKQAFRVERQQLLMEMEEVGKLEKAGAAGQSALSSQLVSFEQKKRLLDRIAGETNVENLSEFIQKYNTQEGIKAETFARIEAQTASSEEHIPPIYSSPCDSDVKLEEALSSLLSGPKDVTPSRKKPKTTSPRSSSKKTKVRSHSITDYFSTPERPRKRRSSTGASLHDPTSGNGASLKPWTPSSAIKSSMNASLVFDMVTSLSTNDPGVAIATLRSIVVLGKEYPSDLLYVELIDRIQSPEAVAYNDAVAIYAALVFVFDKAASCSCAVTFPSQWDPLATALQDVSGNGRVGEDGRPKLDEHWRRNLLVVQFYIYCFQQDLHACRSRYENLEQHAWVYRTRLFSLLQNDTSASSTSAKARAKARASVGRTRNNNLMLQAIGWAVQLWKRVYDDNNKSNTKKSSSAGKMGDTSLFLQQEGEQACLAVLRLIEMLFLCTDQQGNALQRIQAGLMELTQPTRAKFAQAVQSPALRAQLATTMIGLSNKSRSKETEWYECNAMGRVLQAMNPGKTLHINEHAACCWESDWYWLCFVFLCLFQALPVTWRPPTGTRGPTSTAL